MKGSGSNIKTLVAAMGLLGAVGGCAAHAPLRSEVAAVDAASSVLQADFEEMVRTRQIPGAIAIIQRDGRTLVHARAGWMDVERREPLKQDALFRLYSMSKPITSVAILMLADQGRLRLDDPVSKYLPELSAMRVYDSGGLDDMRTVPASGPITIAQLLTHTSGIIYHFTGDTPVHQYYRRYGVMRDTPVGRTPQDGPPARSLDALLARLGEAPLLHQPGETFAYSYSTTVLGAVIERIMAQPLNQALDTMLFTPLGMTDTGFFVSDVDLDRFTTLYRATEDGIEPAEQPETSDYRDRDRLLDGGGAIVGTAADYLRFGRMLANGGEYGGKRFLARETVAAMFTPRTAMEGPDKVALPFGYGVSIGTRETAAAGLQPFGTVSWAGSGNTYFFVDHESRIVALLMTHELTGADQARTLRIRAVLDRAAAPFLKR
ncbi:serine hydrolase domain-containing protein [uncultured Croceicoccus sp.]|uniref:serine hydrolase domain-containing protein n=1 Tax=uncultured Croceicoccus sp. TaxID=1295329 RepID=UPI0026321F45|nr:serine hydrolase domain-containing protein [uncultured Croceicoccus sp.]